MKITLQPIGPGHDYVHIIVEMSCWCPLNYSRCKVRSRDRDASKQRAKNVLLASADFSGGGSCVTSPKNVCVGGY